MKSQTLEEALQTGRGVERPFKCHVHDDNNASASVNVVSKVWVCYACGAAGQVDSKEVAPDLDDLINALKGDTVVRTYPESWLDIFDSHEPSPYWSSRYGTDVASHYRCGTHPVTGFPTYPLRDAAGRINGVVVRDPEANPKYRYPYGSRTSATFFGHIKPRPVVVLVEGAGDVMALHDHPETWTVLGCYGAGIHAPQVDILRQLNPSVIVLAFDDDDAGRTAMSRSSDLLCNLTHSLSYPWGSIGGKDPGDVPAGQAVQGLSAHLAANGYTKYDH